MQMMQSPRGYVCGSVPKVDSGSPGGAFALAYGRADDRIRLAEVDDVQSTLKITLTGASSRGSSGRQTSAGLPKPELRAERSRDGGHSAVHSNSRGMLEHTRQRAARSSDTDSRLQSRSPRKRAVRRTSNSPPKIEVPAT